MPIYASFFVILALYVYCIYIIVIVGEEAALDISVNIPGGLVRSGKLNFMSILTAIPLETIRLKQIAISKIAPHIQYAMPPLDLLKNKSDITQWEPPFKDGVDYTLDGMFVRTFHAINNQSTGIPHRVMTSREWSKEYDVVKIKIPGIPLGKESVIIPDDISVTDNIDTQKHGNGKGNNLSHHKKNQKKKHSPSDPRT